MQNLSYRDADFDARIVALLRRTAFPADIERRVSDMLTAIRTEGDAAVCRYAEAIDKVSLTAADFRVPQRELKAAWDALAPAARAALQTAYDNIRTFSAQRLPRDWEFSPRPGVTLGERFTPMQRVAAYIPGGHAPLVSTVLHTLTMAQVAGVPEIVATTPAREGGKVNPAMLAAFHLVGCTEVYRLGGVYGVGALAFGTETIRPVEKLVGPGNAYVTAAKRLAYGHIALDLVAGPSEVLVIADDTANAAFIAADLLAQAEHGSGYENAFVLSTSAALLERIATQVEAQAARLQDPSAVRRVLDDGVFLIEVADEAAAVALSNRIAPEHLEVMTADPRATAKGLTAAGALFLGPWTPEPVGDFVAGPSHVLPTGGSARYFHGLTVDQFFRRTSVVEYDRSALALEADAVAQFAAMEELEAHGRSVSIRFDAAANGDATM